MTRETITKKAKSLLTIILIKLYVAFLLILAKSVTIERCVMSVRTSLGVSVQTRRVKDLWLGIHRVMSVTETASCSPNGIE